MTKETINRSLGTITKVDYKMWVTLMLTLLLPTVYTTARIFFLGELPTAWGYNIASQLAWVNIMYEVVHEALLLPLYYLIGRVFREPDELRNRIQTGLIVSLGIYAVLGAVISLTAPVLVEFMAQEAELSSATIRYIRLETAAKLPEIAFRFLTIVLVLSDRYRSLLALLGLQMVLTVLLDAFLVRTSPESLGLGVNGIAVSNLLSFTVLSILAYRAILPTSGEAIKGTPGKPGAQSFRWLLNWGKIGGLSGIESLVRNAAFMLMVLRLVNVVQEPGTFWVTNNFIWGWILLPVLSLGTLVKRDAAKKPTVALNPTPYLWLTGLVIGLWLLSVPIWSSFVGGVMGVADSQAVVHLALISLPFYVAFAFNNVIDSIFYGTGRTDLMLVQAVIVNAVVYGSAFALYRAGIFSPTLEGIAILFGIGILLDSLVTFLLYFTVFRRRLAVSLETSPSR